MKTGSQQAKGNGNAVKPVLGITMGDPAGIGPEICLRALNEASVLKQCVPVLFGDAGVLKRVRRSAAKVKKGVSAARKAESESCPVVSLADWQDAPRPQSPLIVDCAAIDAATIRRGEISETCGKAAFAFIRHAIGSAMRKQIDGIITAPIHKEALRLSGVLYPGHTEIFAALTHARRSCMMLHSDVLTVSMVTTHVGYADAPGKLSVKRVLDVIELTEDAMRKFLGRKPRLGVCGLNPHAGEHGLFGRREEERIVTPAIKKARASGILVEGPLPPDAAFTANQRKRFDAIVTLYHDQGHIPFKMLAFDTGVNVTLGLPIVRTSVDHGTAFGIAWKGMADPSSLFEAIRVAAQLSVARNKGKRSK